MNKETWEKWNDDWNWILRTAKKKKWDYQDIEILPPVSLKDVRYIESKYNFKLPEDFIILVTEYASGVLFYWELPDEIKNDAFGYIIRSNDSVWIFNEDYISSPDEFGVTDPNDKYYERIWNKKGIILFSDEAGNYAVLDLSYEDEEAPVINLDHDGDYNGLRFGLNIVDFISRISKIGNVEYHTWEKFYNSKLNLLDCQDKSEAFRQFIENDLHPDEFARINGLIQNKQPVENNMKCTYHWNGMIKSGGLEIDGKKEGVWELYDEWGTLIKSQNYKNNVFNGISHSFYPNGLKQFVTEYENGKVKDSKYFFMDGNPG